MSLVRKHGKQGLFAGLTHLCFYRHGKTRERTVVGKSDETLWDWADPFPSKTNPQWDQLFIHCRVTLLSSGDDGALAFYQKSLTLLNTICLAKEGQTGTLWDKLFWKFNSKYNCWVDGGKVCQQSRVSEWSAATALSRSRTNRQRHGLFTAPAKKNRSR